MSRNGKFASKEELIKISEDYLQKIKNDEEEASVLYYFANLLGLQKGTLADWERSGSEEFTTYGEIVQQTKEQILGFLEKQTLSQGRKGIYIGGNLFLLKCGRRDIYLIEKDIAQELTNETGKSMPKIEIIGVNSSSNNLLLDHDKDS